MEIEAIIKSLEICAADECCDDCLYCGDDNCTDKQRIAAANALKELLLEVSLHETGAAFRDITGKTPADTITAMQGEIDAQAQAIETLHEINAKLEGKAEAYEAVVRMLLKE